MTEAEESFYRSTAMFDDFAQVVDPAVYRPLPDGWWIGLTDVIDSTRAIGAGHYKAVNMSGATGISAVMNAIGDRHFPFVFGGDGASLAVPPEAGEAARDALARTVRWVDEELGLTLRAAFVPVADVRAAGRDVLVARFAASSQVCYAMFAGRGLAWADAQMKAGRYAVPPAPPGARPDLTGLSCRWTPIESQRGCILSLLVAPAVRSDDPAFVDVTRRVVALLRRYEREGHPVPTRGPGFTWPPAGLDLEARASRQDAPLAKQRRKIRLITLIAWVLDKTRWKVGGFDPWAYRTNTSLNTDFRKFDDVLRMTVDCGPDVLAEIKGLLAHAREKGVLRYGLWEQPAALMTCIVPSILTNDHMHFLDGAEGGYARAALDLKAHPQPETSPAAASGGRPGKAPVSPT